MQRHVAYIFRICVSHRIRITNRNCGQFSVHLYQFLEVLLMKYGSSLNEIKFHTLYFLFNLMYYHLNNLPLSNIHEIN